MQNQDDNYQHALNYIYSFIDFSLTRNLRYSPEKFNLERMREFVRILGNPQSDYKVIHVAGTKGKGSTCAMLTSILTSAGYKTGFYSSPHLINFNERIRIGNCQISNAKFVEYVDLFKPYVAKVKEITTFEIITGLTFKYFSDEGVDFGVIEVGMGGRLDATNVVSPLLSVITPISHDHMKVLGTTLPKIAKEKAGIIKPAVPVIVSAQKKSVQQVLAQTAKENNARIVDAHSQFKIKRTDYSLDGQYFTVYFTEDSKSMNDIQGKKFFLPLLGDHQLENAKNALACIHELRKDDYKISAEDIQTGFESIKWPGRFEVISRDPLIIIDGAHNRDSFRKLKSTVDLYLAEKHRIFIFGASEDKEVKLLLSIIYPSIDKLIITRAKHPRALDSDLIMRQAQESGIDCESAKTVEDSLELAQKYYTPNSVILAAGSIFIAGAVRNIWHSENKRKQ